MEVAEIKKKIEKKQDMRFSLILFIIALILFIGIYFIGYNFYDAILGMKNVEKFMFFVGSVTGVLIYNSIILFRYYGYDQPEEEVDDMVAGLSSLMEPIIIVFLGTLIGGIVVSMYLPIFKLGQVV